MEAATEALQSEAPLPSLPPPLSSLSSSSFSSASSSSPQSDFTPSIRSLVERAAYGRAWTEAIGQRCSSLSDSMPSLSPSPSP
jgi:hypothetical protein